jgi:peptidoglycan DL-endopeptidase CwlO
MARRRIRRGRSRVSGGFVASAVAAGVLLAVLGHHGGNVVAAPGTAAAKAVAYARARIGDPYQWGGTGPYGFDCSGLTQMAYRSAGVSTERTSQAQWASQRHVGDPVAGDLVFFAGADGTAAAPGHVGIVTDPARHIMIDAYAAGFPVEYDTYGLASSKPGLSDPVGFTQPWGGA